MSDEQKAQAKKRAQEWRERNLDKVRARKKELYLQREDFYKEYERNRQYQKMYGINIADYDRMLLEQGGVCKMCGADKAGPKRFYFCVDHCHATGRVRALLCTRCNVAVGFYEKHAEKIMKYLQDA